MISETPATPAACSAATEPRRRYCTSSGPCGPVRQEQVAGNERLAVGTAALGKRALAPALLGSAGPRRRPSARPREPTPAAPGLPGTTTPLAGNRRSLAGNHRTLARDGALARDVRAIDGAAPRPCRAAGCSGSRSRARPSPAEPARAGRRRRPACRPGRRFCRGLRRRACARRASRYARSAASPSSARGRASSSSLLRSASAASLLRSKEELRAALRWAGTSSSGAGRRQLPCSVTHRAAAVSCGAAPSGPAC